MAPYFCYIHHGLYESAPDVEGCQHSDCLKFAKKEVRPAGIRVAGFAGSTVTKQARANSDTFHKDMYAYKDAVDQGVEPDTISVKSAELALQHAEATA